jgi:hypothetical protein
MSCMVPPVVNLGHIATPARCPTLEMVSRALECSRSLRPADHLYDFQSGPLRRCRPENVRERFWVNFTVRFNSFDSLGMMGSGTMTVKGNTGPDRDVDNRRHDDARPLHAGVRWRRLDADDQVRDVDRRKDLDPDVRRKGDEDEVAWTRSW